MRLELVVMVGLQGSGKSSYVRAHLAHTHVLVSKDLLRNNRRPQRRQLMLIREALLQGRSVVVDNVNPTLADRKALIDWGKSLGARVRCIFLDTPAELCEHRNALRSDKERVPDVGVRATRKQLVRPTLAEGFDQLENHP